VLDQAEEGTAGADNLYAWDGSQITLVGVLDAKDFIGFNGNNAVRLDDWTNAIGAGAATGVGKDPVRSTLDGGVLVFQSHAKLTSYQNGGVGEIYRYDAKSASASDRVICVSCDPTGLPPAHDAMFENPGILDVTAIVANLTDDGEHVFFEAHDRLLPEDANDAEDVYEWTADGVGGCGRGGGCLALISSGQGESDSTLYGMTPDGHDVFFTTSDRLLPSDVTGSPSIYDARVEGGIPTPEQAAACQGDSCQGQPSIPPGLDTPASGATGSGNVTAPSGNPASGGTKKSLTNAQKLARALKACKAKPKRKRHACQVRARKLYRVKSASRSTTRGTGQ
jgi:hypothetical protein